VSASVAAARVNERSRATAWNVRSRRGSIGKYYATAKIII
jgi:hypothetical protein